MVVDIWGPFLSKIKEAKMTQALPFLLLCFCRTWGIDCAWRHYGADLRQLVRNGPVFEGRRSRFHRVPQGERRLRRCSVSQALVHTSLHERSGQRVRANRCNERTIWMDADMLESFAHAPLSRLCALNMSWFEENQCDESRLLVCVYVSFTLDLVTSCW